MSRRLSAAILSGFLMWPASGSAERRNTRIDAFLLESMRAGNIDAWVILTREGNFDPLSDDFGFHLGRGALLFWDRGGERVTRWALVSSLDVVPLRDTGIYDRVETFERTESFEDELRDILAELDAERIGVNMSASSGIADGLSATYHDPLKRALGDRAERMVSAETHRLELTLGLQDAAASSARARAAEMS